MCAVALTKVAVSRPGRAPDRPVPRHTRIRAHGGYAKSSVPQVDALGRIARRGRRTRAALRPRSGARYLAGLLSAACAQTPVAATGGVPVLPAERAVRSGTRLWVDGVLAGTVLAHAGPEPVAASGCPATARPHAALRRCDPRARSDRGAVGLADRQRRGVRRRRRRAAWPTPGFRSRRTAWTTSRWPTCRRRASCCSSPAPSATAKRPTTAPASGGRSPPTARRDSRHPLRRTGPRRLQLRRLLRPRPQTRRAPGRAGRGPPRRPRRLRARLRRHRGEVAGRRHRSPDPHAHVGRRRRSRDGAGPRFRGCGAVARCAAASTYSKKHR